MLISSGDLQDGLRVHYSLWKCLKTTLLGPTLISPLYEVPESRKSSGTTTKYKFYIQGFFHNRGMFRLNISKHCLTSAVTTFAAE